MRFDPPLVEGVLLRRYKRFLADVEIEGRVVTAHCPNPGSMLDVAVPGSPAALSRALDPRRSLSWTLELLQLGRSWVGVHTGRPNSLVEEAIREERIPELAGYPGLRREVPYGRGSRVDLVLSGPRRKDCYVEVKSVTLASGHTAMFPDSVTARGQKHLRELESVVRTGRRAVVFFWIFRGDCREFRPADHIDAEYGTLLRRAVRSGVEPLAYRARVTPRGATVRDRIPVRL